MGTPFENVIFQIRLHSNNDSLAQLVEHLPLRRESWVQRVTKNLASNEARFFFVFLLDVSTQMLELVDRLG